MVRFQFHLIILVGLFAPAPVARTEPPKQVNKTGSSVLTGLWFTHQYALPHALTPAKDRPLKIKLISTLGKSSELRWDAVGDFFEEAAFRKIAGGESAISAEQMERLIREKTPRSRNDMNAKTRLHADLLTTQFDLIAEEHHKPAEELVRWIVKNYQAGKPLGVIAVCTMNTRRSMLSSAMGNIAAAYYGLTDVRFYSGGTQPDAINLRTIATLQQIGVEIEPTGKEAARGKPDVANPIYRVQWGKGLETREFSKKYTDDHNPQQGFAAIVVCSEADSACPTVTGANVRIPVPYLDPKAFDGAPFEAAKYAERRDDIGRFMLSVLMQARRRLELEGKLK